ncbi:MAG: hypothetical protein AB7N90_10665, partial [Vicinamibacterales bacterium]
FDARLSFLLPAALLLVMAMATPAAAQDVGVRGGVSVDPDQVYLGAHLETAPLVDRLVFRPNLEAGFGDDLTHVGVNLEFAYKFPSNGPWALYAGGGPAANFYRFDRGPGREDGTATEGGLNLLVGVEQASGLFFEFKVGAVDSPDLKFGVGWTFR